MLKVFRAADLKAGANNQALLQIDLTQLKQQECLAIKYDQEGKPVALQKLEAPSFGGHSLFGRAESDILPGQKGRVFYQGYSWQAYCVGDHPIQKGQTVIITARESLRLYVTPLERPFEDL